jgi:hypothetical protein
VGQRSPGSQQICQRTKRLDTIRALAERLPLFALRWLCARVGAFTVRGVGLSCTRLPHPALWAARPTAIKGGR